MPFIVEQPNLGRESENHLYFDPGDGRLRTVVTTEHTPDAGRSAPRVVGWLQQIALSVSKATLQQPPARLQQLGIRGEQCDRGFLDSLSP